MCEVCGKRIEGYNARKYCDSCANEKQKESKRKYWNKIQLDKMKGYETK